MINRKKVREGLRLCVAKDSIGKFEEPGCLHCPYNGRFCQHRLMKECLEMMDEPDSTLGIKITAAGGITFTAAGDAADGERRGILIGKVAMYERIWRDLYLAGLLSKEIRSILTEAKDELIGKAGDDDESGT